MDFRSLINQIDRLNEEAANPYKTDADRAKFDSLTQADQQWLTAGGGVPDINDEFILNRAPNKGKPDTSKAKQGQGAEPAKTKTTTQEKIEKLNQLVDKLVALRSGQASQTPAAAATPVAQPGQSGQAAQPATSFEFKTKDGKTLKLSPEGKPISEGIIARELVESFGYTFNEAELSAKQIGAGVGSGLAKAGLAKAGATRAAKLIPGAGSALSAMNAYNRWQEGDRSGAVIAALAGVGWLVPGPMGWVLGGGLDAANLARDMSKEEPAQQAAEPATKKSSDPRVVALQKYLVSQGATNQDGSPLTVDGILGPNTRAAMDSVGVVMESMVNEATPVEIGKAALNIGKNVVSGLKGGGLVQQIGKSGQFGKAAPGARTALKVGRAVGKHPYAATAGAAGLAGYGLGSTGDTPAAQVAAKPAAAGGGQKPSTTAQAAEPTQWTDEQKELNRQIKDLSQELQIAAGNDPAVQQALSAVGKKMSGITQSSGQAAEPAKPTQAPAQLPSLADWSKTIGTKK